MATDHVPAEIEIKLEAATADDLRDIARLRALGSYRLRPRRTLELHSRYLDTRDFALARAGVALRLRRTGRAWEATAKWGGRVAGALHERPELTVPLPAEPALPFVLPDGPLRAHLTAVVLGRRLMPVLITEVRRELRDVLSPRTPGAESLAELALDTVTPHAPDGTPAGQNYYEVEVEQRAGQPHDLAALGDALQHGFGLVPSAASKFARGLQALHGDVVPPQITAPIAATDSVALAARKMVAAQLARLRAADPGTRLGRQPEPLHDQRVAVRRLRAIVRTAAAGIPPRLRALLTEELRWLGQELGAVRDLDVQLANLAFHAEHSGPETCRRLAAFRRHLQREHALRRTALLAALDSRRSFRLLLALERFASSPPPQRPRGDAAEPIAAVGRRAVKRALRKLMKRGDAIGALPAADDLHGLRIRAKRLRYILEALRPIAGAPSRKLTKKIVRLQDVLGRFNDAVVAAQFVRGYRDGQSSPADATARKTLSVLADSELRRAGAAQSDFARAWCRFSGKSTQRQRRQLLRRLEVAVEEQDSANPPAVGAQDAAQR